METLSINTQLIEDLRLLFQSLREEKNADALIDKLKGESRALGQEIESLIQQQLEMKACIEQQEERIVNFLETIFAFAGQNFEQKAFVSFEGNTLDALAGALNMLGKEMQNQTISRNYFDNMIQSLQDLILVVDEHGKIESVNHATLRTLGFSAQELTGTNMKDLLFRNEDQEKLNDMHRHSFHIKLKDHDQKAFDALVSWSFLKNNQGKGTSRMLVIKDLSELKEKEALISTQSKQLDQKNDYLELFINTATHDLRAPVSNMESLLDLYHQSETSEDQKKLLEGFKHSLFQLSCTLDGLVKILDVHQSYPDSVEKLDFDNCLKKALQLLKREHFLSEVTLNIDFSYAPSIYYNEGFLISILYQAIRNAIYYKKERSELKVDILSRKEGAYTVLSVSDNGIGIDMDNQGHKLFKPFKRLTTRAKGKGIGLCLLKCIVEKNGGHIEVKSTIGQGCCFTFYLKDFTF